MRRKKIGRTPAQDYLRKCAGIRLDPEMRMMIRHLNMLDNAVRYVFNDFARPKRSFPFLTEPLRKRFADAYEPLLDVIRDEFRGYAPKLFPKVTVKTGPKTVPDKR